MNNNACPCNALRLYRVFSHTIATDLRLPFPELSSEMDQSPAYRARRLGSGQPFPEVPRWFRRWEDDDGSLIQAAGYIAQGYVMHFPDTADFAVDRHRGTIEYRSAARIEDTQIGHLLIDQVLPRLFAQQGDAVLHASSVRLTHGALCFLGPSHAGKSTLAAALHARGYEALGDDAVAICTEGASWVCYPAYSGLRLWPDSLERVIPKDTVTAPFYADCSKRRIIPSDLAPGNAVTRLALATVFILNPQPCESKPAISIECVDPVDAVTAFLSHSFTLDKRDSGHMQQQLSRMAAIGSTIPVYRLNYPHDYAVLDEVCDQVLSVMMGSA